MKRALLAVAVLLAAPLAAKAADAYNESLAEESRFLALLDAPQTDGYFELILARLRLYGVKPKETRFDRLRTFVEERLRCEGEVPFDRNFKVGTALELIGRWGGDEGLGYLERVARGGDAVAGLRCFTQGGSPEKTQRHARQAAVLGLGLNGSEKARAALARLQADAGKTGDHDGLAATIRRAVSENEAIAALGRDRW